MVCKANPDSRYDDFVSTKGNPLRTFDKNIFEGLCRIQCTVPEMCAVFRCAHHTLDIWSWHTYGQSVAEVREWLSLDGHVSLRRTQWQQSRRHWGMAIFLGKQYLGQSDKVVTIQEKTGSKIDAMLTEMKDKLPGEFGPEPKEEYVTDQNGSLQSEADLELPGSDSTN